MTSKLSKELLEVLCCPACKSDLIYKEADSKLVCSSCKKEFKVEDGIPIMLVE